jgi:arsenite-transporting ATPase
MDAPSFLYNPDLQLLLFGGKGGVGKTTCAAAAALIIAREYPQDSFLLISTDPAHSLADILGGSPAPTNLRILEFNAQEYLTSFKAMHQKRLKEIASRGTFLDEDDISRLLDLSLPGLDELMAFLEISKWVEDRSYNSIIVDTAPTGHTLNLLSMPELMLKWIHALDTLLAKHRYMKHHFGGSYEKDELDLFVEELIVRVKNVEALLHNPSRSRFVPVMIAENLSTQETLMLADKLERLKIPVLDIVVNKIALQSECPVCRYVHYHQMNELRKFIRNTRFSWEDLWGIPLYPGEIRGIESLVDLWTDVYRLMENDTSPSKLDLELSTKVEAPPTCPSAETGLVIFAGKGGVGKTTLACATAVHLALEHKGKEVFLFSTDPAHSLTDCLGVRVGPKPTRLAPGLTAMEIDAAREFESLKSQYAKDIETSLSKKTSSIDLKFDREVMERIMDLSPPGLDEVMALTMAMDFMAAGSYDIFVLDSAPTGHLVRLLELPELINQWIKVIFGLLLKYRRVIQLPRISQRLVSISKGLKHLRTILTDPARSALYAVGNLTEMSFLETEDLLAASDRIGVHVPVIFLNLATPPGDCPLCSALVLRESQIKRKYRKTFSDRHQTVIYRQSEPRGQKRLADLGRSMYCPLMKGPEPDDFRVSEEKKISDCLKESARRYV